MPRPCHPRRVGFTPEVTYFKPAGVPLPLLEETTLTLDELEALRLADLEGLYQVAAAGKMGVSRTTFARIVAAARRKTAGALINGRAIRVEGGKVFLRGDIARPGPLREQGRWGRGRGGGRGYGPGWGRRGSPPGPGPSATP